MTIDEFINDSIQFVNSNACKEHAHYFYTNGKIDRIKIDYNIVIKILESILNIHNTTSGRCKIIGETMFGKDKFNNYKSTLQIPLNKDVYKLLCYIKSGNCRGLEKIGNELQKYNKDFYKELSSFYSFT